MAIPFSTNFNKTEPFSDTTATIQLVANTPITWTIPGNGTQKYRAEFSFNSNDDIWVSKNYTAVIPVSNTVVTSTQQELRPMPKYVIGGDVLSLITTGSNVQCGIALFQIPNDR
jgi:hypothetical protein